MEVALHYVDLQLANNRGVGLTVRRVKIVAASHAAVVCDTQPPVSLERTGIPRALTSQGTTLRLLL